VAIEAVGREARGGGAGPPGIRFARPGIEGREVACALEQGAHAPLVRCIAAGLVGKSVLMNREVVQIKGDTGEITAGTFAEVVARGRSTSWSGRSDGSRTERSSCRLTR